MLIVKIIYTAFMVWLISFFIVFLQSLWESRKKQNTLAEILAKFDFHYFARKLSNKYVYEV